MCPVVWRCAFIEPLGHETEADQMKAGGNSSFGTAPGHAIGLEPDPIVS